MTTKKQPASSDDDKPPFSLNKEKFIWHKELLASELSPQAKVIGGWFAFHGISSTGKLATHHRRIINETGIPYRSTQRAISELVTHRFLWCEAQPGLANLYTMIATFDRQEMLNDENDAQQQAMKDQQRAEQEQHREDADAWWHAEKSWLRNALLSLAVDGGAPDHLAAEWRDAVMADAQWKIDVACNSGRRLEAHPAREVLDGLDAAQAAEAASRPS